MTDEFEKWWSEYGADGYDPNCIRIYAKAAYSAGASAMREKCKEDANKHYFYGEELSEWHEGYSQAVVDIIEAIERVEI